jgi:hypothetical protein
MSNIEKKSKLSGSIEKEIKDPEHFEELKKIKEDSSTVNIVNPITGKSALVKISRDGTTDEKLAAIMLHPESTREQKDSMIANYLFERGLESASFLMELFKSKGMHTKETRAFKSQIRFDFEMLVNLFVNWLESTSENIRLSLGLNESFYEDYVKMVEKNRKLKGKLDPDDLVKIMKKMFDKKISKEMLSLYTLYVRFKEQSKTLVEEVRKITMMREKERGWGIYVSKTGKIYDITDKDISEIVMKECEEYNNVSRQNTN